MLKRLLHIMKNFNNDSEEHYGEVVSGVEQVLAMNSKELESAKKRSIEINLVIKELELDKEKLHNQAKDYLKANNKEKAHQVLENEKIIIDKLTHQESLRVEIENYIKQHIRQIQSVQLKLERLKSKQVLLNSGTDGIKNLKAASEQIDDVLNSEELYTLGIELEAMDMCLDEENEIERALEEVASPKTEQLQRELQQEAEEQRKQLKEQRNKLFEQHVGSINNDSNVNENKNKKYEQLIEFKNTQSKKGNRNEELLESFKESDGFHQQQKIKEFFKK